MEVSMADLNDAARAWLTGRTRAVLITTRADGSPQSSNVLTAFDGTSFRVSVTADRAKTRNLARDPRAVVHVVGDDFWSYASVSCQTTVGDVTTTPGDDAGRALLDTYESITGQTHADPDEFFAAMVAEHRLVLSLVPTSVVGSGW
jgi:PPOX class probable F420-dependent enzyme